MSSLADDRVMTVEEVADYLRMTPDWVREMARTGKMPSFKLGRYRRFYEADVIAWITSQRGPVDPGTVSRLQVVGIAQSKEVKNYG